VTAVHICRPASVTQRRVLRCPTCQQRRRFVEELYVWYDSYLTCVACGDAWSGRQRMLRPAAKEWRAGATVLARYKWASALPAQEARASFRQMVEAS